MIGKFIVFVAVAVSCSTAVPFGNCGSLDTVGLGNMISSPANIIPNGLNLQGPAPLLDTPNFPVNNVFSAAVSNPMPLPAIPPFPALSGTTLPGPTLPPMPALPPLPALPPFPTPSFSVQRIQGPQLGLPNVQIQSFQAIPPSPIVQNIEPRLQTIQTRIPSIQTRIPSFDTCLPGFPAAQQQIFPAPSIAQTPFPC